VNEAYRARDEGVAAEGDIDRALRLGAGHPAGPFERWADRGGAATIRDRLAEHADLGLRFVPARGLRRRDD
jgi:3-hydroxyacyl-CoA dehydrogenase